LRSIAGSVELKAIGRLLSSALKITLRWISACANSAGTEKGSEYDFVMT